MKSSTITLALTIFLSVAVPITGWTSGAVGVIRQKQMMEQEAYMRAVQEEMAQRQQQEMMRQYMAAYQQAAVAQYVEAQKQAMTVAAVQQQMAGQYRAQQMSGEI